MFDHPLFPPPDDGQEHEPVDIAKIQVTRFEGGMQKYAPQLFHANELLEMKDVHELFGGGAYELIGRAPKGHIARKERFNIAGAPKPLDTSEQGVSSPAPAGAAYAYAPGPTIDLNAILMAAVPALIGLFTADRSSSSNASIEMMKVVQQQNQQQEAARLAAMQQWQQQQNEQQRQFFELMRATSSQTKGGDMDSFTAGMEFCEKVLGKQTKANAPSPRSDAEVLVEGVGMIASLVSARDEEDRRARQQQQLPAGGGGGGAPLRQSTRPPPPMNGVNGQAHHAPPAAPVQGPAQ